MYTPVVFVTSITTKGGSVTVDLKTNTNGEGVRMVRLMYYCNKQRSNETLLHFLIYDVHAGREWVTWTFRGGPVGAVTVRSGDLALLDSTEVPETVTTEERVEGLHSQSIVISTNASSDVGY